jgi:tetratricopeptide (TPR) repeat protein
LSITFSALLIYFFKGNKEAFFFENLVNKEINKITNNPESLKEINPQKIIFFLESKLRQNPMDLEGWKVLARTCLMTGHIQKAELYYTKALKYFPLNESLIYEYAVLKKNTDQLNGALNLLKKVDVKKTQDTELIYLYLNLLKETANTDGLNKKISDLENNKSIDSSEKKNIFKKLKLN